MTEDPNGKQGGAKAPLRWNRKMDALEDALRDLPEYQRDGFRAAIDAMAEFEDAATNESEGPNNEEPE